MSPRETISARMPSSLWDGHFDHPPSGAHLALRWLRVFGPVDSSRMMASSAVMGPTCR